MHSINLSMIFIHWIYFYVNSWDYLELEYNLNQSVYDKCLTNLPNYLKRI